MIYLCNYEIYTRNSTSSVALCDMFTNPADKKKLQELISEGNSCKPVFIFFKVVPESNNARYRCSIASVIKGADAPKVSAAFKELLP